MSIFSRSMRVRWNLKKMSIVRTSMRPADETDDPVPASVSIAVPLRTPAATR